MPELLTTNEQFVPPAGMIESVDLSRGEPALLTEGPPLLNEVEATEKFNMPCARVVARVEHKGVNVYLVDKGTEELTQSIPLISDKKVSPTSAVYRGPSSERSRFVLVGDDALSKGHEVAQHGGLTEQLEYPRLPLTEGAKTMAFPGVYFEVDSLGEQVAVIDLNEGSATRVWCNRDEGLHDTRELPAVPKFDPNTTTTLPAIDLTATQVLPPGWLPK